MGFQSYFDEAISIAKRHLLPKDVAELWLRKVKTLTGMDPTGADLESVERELLQFDFYKEQDPVFQIDANADSLHTIEYIWLLNRIEKKKG